MADIKTQIRQAAPKNAELLRVLKETDCAPPAFKQQKRFLADLYIQLRESDRQVKRLNNLRIIELGQHERYRDSHLRRFMYKAAGKQERFAQKAEKEEREYFEVLQRSHQEQQINDNLRVQIAEAEKARDAVAGDAQRHEEMQRELDNMYRAIFAGPTPEFPEEDALEQKNGAAQQAYHDARIRAEVEDQVVTLLREGMRYLGLATKNMEEALLHSRADMFGGGTMSDLMERNALSGAERFIQEARMQVDRARSISPLVAELPPVRINPRGVFADVFFDNIYDDMAFHDEIKRGRVDLFHSAESLKEELQQAEERKGAVGAELGQWEAELEQARLDLQNARAAAFERVVATEKA